VIPLQVVAIALVALSGTAVALTRDVLRQILTNSLYGLTLVVLFVVYQAPDVSLSAIVVGSVGLPLVLLVGLATIRSREK
jgi:uncharacterized MnhB-related membrane protein